MRQTMTAAVRALRSGAAAGSRVNGMLCRVFGGGVQPRPGAGGSAAPSVTLDSTSAGHAGRWAVEQISGRFVPGTLTAAVGPNGAGKSTLMAMLAGLARAQSGSIRTEDATPDVIGYLPQTAAIERSYPVSALESAALGRWREFGAFGTPPRGLLPEVMAAP